MDFFAKKNNKNLKKNLRQFHEPRKEMKIFLDSQFIFDLTGSSDITRLPGIYSDSPIKQNSTESFFEKVPKTTIKKLFNYYFMDFLLFNYTIDSFL